jgi:hypothetical protein
MRITPEEIEGDAYRYELRRERCSGSSRDDGFDGVTGPFTHSGV